jgi:hypothetical protein
MKKVIPAAIGIVLILALILGFYLFSGEKPPTETKTVTITSFNECMEANFPVQEKYPRVCVDSEGNSFEEYVGNVTEKQDLIILESPLPNSTVKNPIQIKGQARGTWFFEGSFPIVVVNWDGLIIGEGFATAQKEWMTENFVPFTATINYNLDPETYSKNGGLILQKDNPSDLPEQDDSLEIPIVFE